MNRMISSLCNGIGLASLAMATLTASGCGGDAGSASEADDPAGETDGKADWRSSSFRPGSSSGITNPTIPPGRQTSDFDYTYQIPSDKLHWNTDGVVPAVVPASGAAEVQGGVGVHWHGYELSADANGLVHVQTSVGSGPTEFAFNLYPVFAAISARASLNGSIGADALISVAGQRLVNEHLDKDAAKSYRQVKALPFDYGSRLADGRVVPWKTDLPMPDDVKKYVNGSILLLSSGNASVTLNAMATPRQVQASASARFAASTQVDVITNVGASAHGNLALLDDQLDLGTGAEFQQRSDRSWEACFYVDAHNRLNQALQGSLTLSADIPVVGHKEYTLLSWPGVGPDDQALLDMSTIQMPGTHRSACGPLHWDPSVGANVGSRSCICKPFLK